MWHLHLMIWYSVAIDSTSILLLSKVFCCYLHQALLWAMPIILWFSFCSYKECFQGPNDVWQLDKKDVVDYFTLEDLWEHYSESSAYGLSVPVRLEHGKFITQHFVPYLSAIQIYTSKTFAVPRYVPNYLLVLISCKQDCSLLGNWPFSLSLELMKPHRSMGSDETDSWSDDSTAEKLCRSWDAASDDSCPHQDLDSVPAKQGGYLNFQYSEWDPPYERIPLADKVFFLA